VAPDHDLQIGLLRGEQTRIQVAFGRKPGSCARTKERLAYRGNQSNFLLRADITIACCTLAEIVGFCRLEKHFMINDFDNLTARNDMFKIPAITIPHVHELNKSQDMSSVAEVTGHRNNILIIDTFLDDHIYLYG